MEHRPINAFAEQKLDQNMKLAIARDLQRIWSDVLDELLDKGGKITQVELRWQAETPARIGLAGRGCIRRIICHVAEVTWRVPPATFQRRVAVLHA